MLAGPGPFVGRGHELERLSSAWQTALAGGTNAMLIAGEPGVGKTRLAGEWSRQAYDQGALVIYGRCDEDLGAPYQPFAEALRSLVPCLGAGGLRGLRGVEALLTLVPGLADLLPDLAAPTRADPDTERYALFDAVVALLAMASASAPVVLILDDLHWAAKPTLLLLRHLLRFGEHARVQIIGTYRSTDLDRAHPLAAMLADLHRDGTANRLSLSGLDEDDVTAYVAEAGYNDEELARALASVTGGNPFFLIEALRHVDESGGRWDQSTLPQGVREAVSRRLSRLPAETNKALAAAAVVGSRFALELVERVVGDDLVDAFDEACKAGIIIEEPGGRYRFNHALVRQSLLAELPSVRRMRLHQRIATTLENEPGADDELLAELAYHYFECAWAGNAAKAVEYCRRAADQAMARLAYEGAADLYDRALHALEEIDEELPDRDEQAAELLVARCEALLAAGDVTSAAAAVAQLQTATADSARLAAWATCFDGQLSMLIHPERLDEAEAAVGAAADKLAELDDAAGEAKAHTVRAGCLARLGRIGDCEIALDDALTAARRAGEYRRVNAVLAGAPLAALWGPNPVPRAGGRCLDVVRLLRITTDSPAVEATSTRCQAVLEAFRGRAAAARRMIDSARRTVTELGLRHALLEVEQFAGIVELVGDDPAAAEPHLRQAYNGFRRMGLDADTAETAALLGRTCLALGRDAEAGELCSESECLAGHALKPSIAWRTLRAHLLSRGGDHDGALRFAEAAVSLAERTDLLVDHGDACLSLAKVLGAAGDVAGARAAAERSVGLYERKGAAALAERARHILGERVVPAVPTPPAAPSVEPDNACARVIRRGSAAIDRGAWDEFERLYAPKVFVESRRKITGGFTRDDFSPGEGRSLAENGALRIRVPVIAVRGERLALSRLEIGTADVSAGAPCDEMLGLYSLDRDGRIALQVFFDVEDIDAALAELDAMHARFEAEQPPARRLENTAARVFEHVWSHFAARDWDAMAGSVADYYVGIDHRRVVSAETQHSRDDVIRDLQAAADVGFTISMVRAIAIRGERLVLARVRASGSDPEAIQNDALNVVEIDADERIATVITFDIEDIDAALAELDARYLAGEEAAHPHMWSAMLGAYAAINRRELPATTPDFVSKDHRRGAAFAPGDMIEYLRAGWDLDQEIYFYIEAVHRLSDLGVVVTHKGRGTSREGFDAEWREVMLFTVNGLSFNRCEVFDERDLNAAIARFDQLSRPAPRLGNAASQAYERVQACFAARDWEAMANALAHTIVDDDRRRMVNAGIRRGRDIEIANGQAVVEIGGEQITSTVIATRGENVALCRSCIFGQGQQSGAFRIEFLSVIESDADERLAAHVAFDLDDIDAAQAELDARYLAGEAAAHAHTWSVITESYAALNRREHPATTPDWVSIDHRRGISFPPGAVSALLANWNATADLSNSIEAVHRLNDRGAVVTSVTTESSREGFEAEWRGISVLTVEGDLIDGLEVFDEADVGAAIVRFEQLSRSTPRLENTATRVFEHVWSHFAARNWEALAETVADSFSGIDHRRVVNAGIQDGRDAVIRDLQVSAEVGFTISMVSAMAIRGERLVLARVRASGPDPESIQDDALNIVEIDANNRIAAVVVFDLDDLTAAIAELDARYLAGEAAPYADTWPVIAGTYASIRRREFPSLTPNCVSIDHRPAAAFAAGELTAYIRAGWEIDQDIRPYVEAVHRLDGLGAVVSYAAHGTSHEGFDAEWREIALVTVEGDMVNRCELFDEADLETAIARFEQLSRPAPRLENAASRTYDRLQAHYAARDWAAISEMLSEDHCSDDRRAVVGDGIQHGRDALIENLRTVIDVGVTQATSNTIATRGAHLALTLARYSRSDEVPAAFHVDYLQLIEIDADERITALVAFDPDRFDAAYEELDARYLAGEAAPYARVWQIGIEALGELNRHQPGRMLAGLVYTDHRHVSFASGDYGRAVEELWALVPNARYRTTEVYALDAHGSVFKIVIEGTDVHGNELQWPRLSLLSVGPERARVEVYDEDDVDAALARFEELRPEERRLANAASQAYDRVFAWFAARDWDAMAEIVADAFSSEDRRQVVNAGVRHGRDAGIEDVRAIADVGFTLTIVAVMATRGGRLALLRVRAAGPDPGGIQNDALNLVEIDTDERVMTSVVFDLDNFEAAVAELDARYLAGEAAAHSQVWSIVAGSYAALNRRELPMTAPDCVYVDHRRETAFGPGDLAAYIGAGWASDQAINIYVEQVHRLTSLGAVITYAAHETREGFDAEWRGIVVLTVDGGLVDRCEVFDDADADAAIARLEQLSRPARLENAASQVCERYLAHYAARDWDAMAEILAHDFSSDDRRRVVSAGVRHGRDAQVANMQAFAALAIARVTSTSIATRGERLVLQRVRFSDRDQTTDAFLTERLGVGEINAEGRIAAFVSFELDDIDAAIEELDARYLAGEAAAHSHMWSVVAKAYAALNRNELPSGISDWVTLDHRVRATFEGGDLTAYIRAGIDLTPNINIYIETVHRLSDFGAVVTHAAHGTTQEGFDAEWRMIELLAVGGETINRCELFDEADLDAALARFDELQPRVPRLENAAGRILERYQACFSGPDWAAMAELLADDIVLEDRRRVVNAGVRRGRDVHIADLRAAIEVGADTISLSVIATRGECLALAHARAFNRGSPSGEVGAEWCGLAEIDTVERIVGLVSFDLDDIDAAFAELDARYLAGEAAAHSQPWSVIAGLYAGFNRQELPATTPDWTYVDHRSVVNIEATDLPAFIRAGWDLTPEIGIYMEAVHRLSDLGAVVTHTARGISREDFDAEWRMVDIFTVEGDLISRCEMFDEADLDAALASFEELHRQTRRLENAASQVVARFWTCLATRDWVAMAETMASDFSSHDHRRVVNSDVLRGRDVNIANMRAVAEVGFEGLASTVIATRGQRLALSRIRSSVHGFEPGEVSADMLGMFEIDADNRLTASAIFDAEDIDAAFEELDTRYLAGDAAAHARTWSAITQAYDALNRGEMPTTTPNFEDIDRRRGAMPAPGYLMEYLRAALDDAVGNRLYIVAVHRLTDLGAVVTHVARATSREGFDAEWRITNVFTVEGDLVGRCELFDEADLDTAITRFEELQPPAPRLENAATLTDQRFWDYFSARDWAALGSMLADDMANDDRRRIVNAGIRRGRDVEVANMRTLSDMGVTNVTSTVIATRGERLLLRRTRFSLDQGPEDFHADLLCIVELDAEIRIATRVLFDPDDFEPAYEELDARYLAGEAAAHSHVWSVIAGECAAFNRHELPAAEWVTIDHRQLAVIDAREGQAAMRDIWEVTPNLSMRIEAVHRLSSAGAVSSYVASGTSPEGVDAEWPMILLLTVEGDRIGRCEIFDEADLDAALARFDELSPPMPLVESAGD